LPVKSCARKSGFSFVASPAKIGHHGDPVKGFGVTSDTEIAVVDRRDQLPALPTAEIERAKDYARSSRAASTRRVYESDWKHFSLWCADRNMATLPAEAAVVAVYLGTEADRGLSPLTIGRKLAAIGWMHRNAGHQAPQNTEAGIAILSVMGGIRRMERASPVKKSAADADITRDILRSITGDSLHDVRDRAVIAFGMLSAMRRSELVALRIEDLKRQPEGMLVFVRRSKGDQEGKGETIPVPAGRRIRPVELLEAWLTAAGITEGFVFRRISRCGKRVRPDGMSDQAVARIVQSRVAAAGYDPAEYAGHSLRSGFLTSAARAGASIFKMKEVSRHKSLDVLAGYVRDAQAFTNHAGDDFA
jgi:site-specific recombinase XerD